MKKKRRLLSDSCLSLLISSMSNGVLLVEAVLVQLNNMPTYNIVFDSEEG